MKNLLDINASKPYTMSKVNLDALIPRADFIESTNSLSQGHTNTLTLAHLVKDQLTSVYSILRKPDFQRETNEWDKTKIADLIDCFMDGNFVPSVILWKNNQGLIFVIDGAHRISALLSYIHDDYGDREISQKYFNYNIPDEEIALAEECRKYINRKLGSFEDMQHIFDHPEAYKEDEVIRARRFRTLSLKVQEIENATVKDAERSFFKINQQGVALSPTEKKLCFARYKPNSIATRAIMKGGYGFQYWKDFSAENQKMVKDMAIEIHNTMFKPPLLEKAKSHEFFPMGGNITSAMPMIFDFVNIVNKSDDTKGTIKLSDDKTGEETIKFLKRVRKAVWLINSEEESSLGLHPLVYFYTSTGSHQQTAFLSLTQVILELERDDKLPYFIQIRQRFENFIIKYKVFVVQIIRRYGSKLKADRHLRDFYRMLIEAMTDHKPDEEIIKSLRKEFDVLNPDESELEKTKRSSFPKDISNAAVISADLEGCKTCKICGSRLQHKSISKDHNVKKEYGGDGNIENLNITHPYCNTGYKNWKEHQEKLQMGKK